MNKWLKIIIGLIVLTGTILLVFPNMPMESWGKAALTLVKGGITLLAIFVGLILIVLGIMDLKN